MAIMQTSHWIQKLILIIGIQPPVFFQHTEAGICPLHTGARDTAVTATILAQCSQNSSDARGADGLPLPAPISADCCNERATELVEPILHMVSGEGGEARLLIQRSQK